ncbi:MAG: hypothetical protein M3540_13265 [Actinomycetota bacterium]|nr:hypothetical protein [Actinomycetota bacterium]
MRPVLVLLTIVAALAAGCSVRRAAAPPSPYCRSDNPLAGVYHPSRLHVRSKCRVVSGVVERVKFEEYDGDVHIDLRPDDPALVSDGNDRVGGALVVEVIPQDRARVPIPEPGQRVWIVGSWVDDERHGWREIHPAVWISAGRIRPASPSELAAADRLLRGRSTESE